MNKRIKFISLLQTIAIILVVVGHSLHEYPVNHGEGTLVYRMIYAFHMPLFVFISGFLFSYSLSRSGVKPYGQFLVDKVLRLLVPYFVLGAATFIPRVMMSGVADDAMELSFGGFMESLLYYDKLVIVFFWFLTMLFVLFNVMYGAVRIFKSRLTPTFYMVAGGVAIALNLTVDPYGVQLFSLGRVAQLMVYFVAGMAYAAWRQPVDRRLHFGDWVSIAVFSGLFVGLFFCRDMFVGGEMVCAFFGVGMTVALAHILEKYNVRFLDHLEGFSYMIFLLSWYTGTFSQQVLHHFTDFDWWVYTIIAIALSIYVPWIFGKWVHGTRHKRLARWILFCLGEKQH